MLGKLVAASDKQRFTHSVISLTAEADLAERIKASGARLDMLNLPRSKIAMGGLLRLTRLIKDHRADIVQTWLYHADLAGTIAAKLTGKPVLWNLRCSNMNLGGYTWRTAAVLRLLTLISAVPECILVNSIAGQTVHSQQGYQPRRWVLVPNGFDLAAWGPQEGAGQRLKHRLGLSPEHSVIAHVARLDPMKDHRTFLRAAKRLADSRPSVRFLLVGAGTERLGSEIAALGLGGHCIPLGAQEDVAGIMAGADLVCLSSAYGEGFPNVIGEAMACAVPCVATDVGDAARIIGDTGRIVPPRDPEALAQALLDLLSLTHNQRQELGERARKRISATYGIASVIGQYEDLYATIAGKRLAENHA